MGTLTALGDAIRSSGRMEKSDIKHLPNLHCRKAWKKKNLTHNWLNYLHAKPTSYSRREVLPFKDVHQLQSEGFSVFSYGSARNLSFTNNTWLPWKDDITPCVGAEIYQERQPYGRYQSYGAVLIMGNGHPVSKKEEVALKEGWDWNHIPGTTTHPSSIWIVIAPSKVLTWHGLKRISQEVHPWKENMACLLWNMERGIEKLPPDFSSTQVGSLLWQTNYLSGKWYLEQ